MRLLHEIAIFQTVKSKVIISLFETVRLSVSISLRNLYNSLNSIKEMCIYVISWFELSYDFMPDGNEPNRIEIEAAIYKNRVHLRYNTW